MRLTRALALMLFFLVAGPAWAAITITDQAGPSFSNSACPTGTGGASWTPPDGTVVIAWVTNTKATAVDTVTLSGNSLTWTEIATVSFRDQATPLRRLTAFRAFVTGATAGAITLNFAATQTGCALVVQTVAGTLTTGTNAADAIVQSPTAYSETLTTRSPCITPCATDTLLTLAALTNRSNAVIAGFTIDDTVTPVAPSGWTLGTIQQYSSPVVSSNAIWSTAPDTIYPAVTWTGDARSGGIALELAVASAPASATSITHGPFVGGVTSTAATLWVRGGSAGEITMRWGTSPTLAGASTQAVSVGPSTDFTATLAVSGLPAGTPYYYQAVGDVTASAIHTFTTFPAAPTTATIVLLTDFEALASVAAATPSASFTQADAEAPNFVLIGGDFDHSNPGQAADEITSRTDQRAMWKRLYNPTPDGNRDMAAFVVNILRKYPIAHAWDDHDYQSNNSNKNYNWRVTVAKPEYAHFFPSYALPSIAAGIWQSFSYGTLATIFLLDDRSQRDPNNDADDANKSMLDGNALGATGQKQWLKDGLLAEQAAGVVWKLVAVGVPWNRTSQKGSGGNFDNWYSFQTEQDELRTYITANNIRNVVLLTGDGHIGALENGTTSPANLPEIMGPAANFSDSSCNSYGVGDVLGTWSHGTMVDTAPAPCNGYTVLSLTTSSLTATVKSPTGAQQLQMTLHISSGREPSFVTRK